MKWKLLHVALLGAGIFLASAGVRAQEPRSGTFKAVEGKAAVVVQGVMARVAAPGGGVGETERIVTEAGSTAVLVLRDGTIITIGPNSSVDITRFQFDSTAQTGSLTLSLLLGTVRMITGLLGKLQPENVKVITPSSTVSVRGTDFIVEVPQ